MLMSPTAPQACHRGPKATGPKSLQLLCLHFQATGIVLGCTNNLNQ